MAFLSLLIKEMRLRLRHERTIWLIIAYTLCIGILGWVSLTHNNNYTIPDGSGLNAVGLNLYSLLIQLQLFLLIFIAPTFTVTAINGEKECQTFELLVCSQLSAVSLISGKLVAGLASTLFLVVASIPLFSMIFFFGGVSLAQVFSASLVCLITIIFVGAVSIFCSTLFRRPAISVAITYTILLAWLLYPLLILCIFNATGNTIFILQNSNIVHILLGCNPMIALTSTYPGAGTNQLFAFISYGFALNDGNTGYAKLSFFSWNIDPWLLYSGITFIIILVLFLLCLPFIRTRQSQWLALHSRWTGGHS